MGQKKILLHQVLNQLPITDFDMNDISTTFIERNGWNDGKNFDTAIKDCLCYMAVKLANKH